MAMKRSAAPKSPPATKDASEKLERQPQSSAATATEPEPQRPQNRAPETDDSWWRILVVAVGLGMTAATSGPKQRIGEMCLHPMAEGSSFCDLQEDTRANVVLSLAACLFLADVLVRIARGLPSFAYGGVLCVHEAAAGVALELRRCWRRRRKRLAREAEKKQRQEEREAALEVDRRTKRLAELERTITAEAVGSKLKKLNVVQRQKKQQMRPERQEQEHAPQKLQRIEQRREQPQQHVSAETKKRQRDQRDLPSVDEPSGLPVVAQELFDDTLSVDGSEAGSEQSKSSSSSAESGESTESDGSGKSKGSSDYSQAEARTIAEGVVRKRHFCAIYI